MPHEDKRTIEAIRDFIVENIDEVIYDTNDTSNNNIVTCNPDQIVSVARVPFIAVYNRIGRISPTMNQPNRLHKIRENPDGSFVVWKEIGVKETEIVVCVLDEKPSSIIELSNKLEELFLKQLYVKNFTLENDGIDSIVDIYLNAQSRIYKSNKYPYRKDIELNAVYYLYTESIEYPVNNIITNLYTNQPIDKEPEPPTVPTEIDYNPLEGGIQIDIHKI